MANSYSEILKSLCAEVFPRWVLWIRLRVCPITTERVQVVWGELIQGI